VLREAANYGRNEYNGPAAQGNDLQRTAQESGMASERAESQFPDRIHVRSSAADREAEQEAGLAALIGISVHASLALSEVATTIIPRMPSLPPNSTDKDYSSQGFDNFRARETNTDAPKGRLRLLLTHLRTDHLVRNTLYLILSSGLQAALGFTFWIVMARLFSTEDIGRASSLISATAIIGYFSLFGLDSTLVRFLPTARDKGPLITAAFILVAGVGAIVALAYILLTPVIAPRLTFVEHRPALTVGFVLLAAAAAVNLLTDSVFMASRKAGFCALTDGAVGGLSKIVFGVILAGTGAYGIFCASVGGLAAAALVSVVLIVTILHQRPSLKKPFQTLRPLLKFSGANYIVDAMNLLPTVVVPLVVLDRLGAKAAAYYFVAYQMATLLYSSVWAVESAFLAEGSQAEADWRAIRRRSRRLAVMIFVPGAAVLALSAHWVLLVFGSGYSQHSTAILELLAVAVIPIAANGWSWQVLRLSGRLTALVVSSAVYSSAICGFAWILAPHGLVAVTAAWPVGAALAAVIATVLSAASSKAPARHRRTTRSKPARRRTARTSQERGIPE
jgi:O-antigen/teichoic acid export membrane protein